jgi:hypothetical protein
MSICSRQAGVCHTMLNGHRQIQLFKNRQSLCFVPRFERSPTQGRLIGTSVGEVDAVPLDEEPTE